ncbi:MAG: DNA polymerase III subunit beta [bacterium]|nr:DNA polymerase III subunit beta [bacterium]
MNLIVLKENLKRGLDVVERVIGKNISLPILNNIFLSSEKNFLKLSATDLEIGIHYWVLTKIEKEGSVVIPGRVLSSFISYLQDQKINIKSKGLDLVIEAEKNRTQIKGFDANEYPIIPKIESEEFIEVNSQKFIEGLNQVVEVVSTAQMRPEITGILLFFDKDAIKIVGTDSFRLAEKKITINTKIKDAKTFIIPKKTIKELISVFGDKKQKIKIFFSPNQIMFESNIEEIEHPEVQIISRLIDGDYPNYQEIVPKSFATQAVVNRDELIRQIKTASLFVDKNNEIKVSVNPENKEIEIKVQNPDIGENTASLQAKIKGEKIDISFNWKFLLDGLVNIKSDQVLIGLNGEEGPAIVKSIEEEDYIYVVMPVKIS